MGMLSKDRRPVVACGETRTKQSFADQVNINKIIERHRKTGMVSHLNAAEPFYGDVSELRSYEESLMVVQKATDLFMGMSSSVRARFDNDPQKMIEFLEDPKNHEEAIKLGMVLPRKEVVPQEVEIGEKSLKKLKEASSGKGGKHTPKDED